jgi:DNA helicase-2/ATP-dependent DNA helicase PcrA
MIDAWNGAGSFMGAAVPTSLADLVERVISESALERHYASKLDKATGEPDEDRLANLEELVTSAAEFEDAFDPTSDPAFAEIPADVERVGDGDADARAAAQEAEPELLQMLRAYLESVALVADADKVDPSRGAVTLMTLHAAKGLEFPAVAMVGLEEGLLPGQRAIDSDEQLEEERRLTFVGITRAMRTLLMTSAKYRTHRGIRDRAIPSRFLSELPAEHVTISDQSDEFAGIDPAWADDDGAERRDWADDGLTDDAFAPESPFHADEFDQRPEEEKRGEATKRGGGGRRGARGELAAKVSKGLPSRGAGSLDRGDAGSRRRHAASGAPGGGGARDPFAPSRRVGAQLEAGMIVRHPQFGEGVVEAVSGAGMKKRATIDFDDLGRRTLVLGYTRLTPVGWRDGDGGATSPDASGDEPPF